MSSTPNHPAPTPVPGVEAPPEAELELEGKPPPPPDPWLGRMLDGRYRVIERLGQGGMGTVYVAEHLTLRKQVALKLVHGEEGENTADAQRFVREAMVTSLIDHPNVISAIDFGTFDNGTAYLAMNLVRGPTLGRVLRDQRRMSWLRAADLGSQIADALCAAQAHGIVHRDLKPDNVILQKLPDGTELVKLLDFGIAKHARDSLAPPSMRHTQSVTRVGVVIGTLGYMAPEQAVGKRADHRSDLYALGALLWECVVGRKLWSSDDVQTLLAEQLNKPARSVREASGDTTMPEAFERMVSRLLAINPLERPQNPAEARDVLREIVAAVKQGTLPGPARLPDPPPPMAFIETLAATVIRPSPKPGVSPAAAKVEPLAADPARLAILNAPTRKLARPISPPAPRPPEKQPLWKNRAAIGAAVFLLLGASAALLVGRPSRAEKAGVQAPKKHVVALPLAVGSLADSVRPLLNILVDGASREERVAAAEALLRHVPVDEVPAYGRAMAHLQLAETCPQKKEELATITVVDDPRVLPVLIALAHRRRNGCGPKGREDCLSCLRDELEALVKHLELKQMTQR